MSDAETNLLEGEIEVTPEMIEAGVSELAGLMAPSVGRLEMEETAWAVYEAMRALECKLPSKGRSST